MRFLYPVPLSDLEYVGCFADGSPDDRHLDGPAAIDAEMTLLMCAQFCVDYPYLGLQVQYVTQIN